MRLSKTQIDQKAKSKRQLCATVLNMLLVLVVFAMATYAWFFHSVENNGNGSNLTSSQAGVYTSDEYQVFRYFDNVKKGVQVSGNDVTLDGYDAIFSERNEHMAIILRIPVTGDAIKAGKTFKMAITCEEGDYLVDGDTSGTKVVDSKISNAITMKCAYISSLDTKIASGDTTGYADLSDMIYWEALNYLDATSSTQTGSSVQTGAFVSGVTEADGTISYSDAKKSQEVSFTIPAGYTTDDNDMLYLYVEVNYDDLLARAYFTSNLGKKISLSETNMPLDNDLLDIVFSDAE